MTNDAWKTIVQEAMEKDYSWAQSAFKYNQLICRAHLKE